MILTLSFDLIELSYNISSHNNLFGKVYQYCNKEK